MSTTIEHEWTLLSQEKAKVKWHEVEFSISVEQFKKMWPRIRQNARGNASSATLTIPTNAAQSAILKIPVPRMSAYKLVDEFESGSGVEENDYNSSDEKWI